MKPTFIIQSRIRTRLSNIMQLLPVLCLFLMASPAIGQEEEAAASMPVARPVANTFESAMLIDNQSVMVPIKGTFEFDIQHRFGTMQNGFEDLFGMYATSFIRLGFSYAPIDNLSVGFGYSKKNSLVDFSAKYALLRQYKDDWRRAVSVTYYGNMAINPKSADDIEIYHESDRFCFFNQIIIARKFNNWLSFQVAPSLSHYNLQPYRSMKNDHFAIAFGAQVKVTEGMAFIVNVDQPLTQHDSRNPNPNVSLGLQMTTSSHAFQIFVGNYDGLVPQENNMYYRWVSPEGNSHWNGFDRFVDRFRIGFNITRLWNF